MGELRAGGYIITARAVDEKLSDRFKAALELTELTESKLARYLIVRGLDAFDQDGRLGPFVFQPKEHPRRGKNPG